MSKNEEDNTSNSTKIKQIDNLSRKEKSFSEIELSTKADGESNKSSIAETEHKLFSAGEIDKLASSDKTLSELGISEYLEGKYDFSEAAEKEEELIASGELALVSKQNSHRRNETWKDDFDKAFRCLFWLSAFLFGLMVIALALHWIIPDSCQWLSQAQISKIEAVVIAVIVSKAVTTKQNKLES